MTCTTIMGTSARPCVRHHCNILFLITNSVIYQNDLKNRQVHTSVVVQIVYLTYLFNDLNWFGSLMYWEKFDKQRWLDMKTPQIRCIFGLKLATHCNKISKLIKLFK